MVGEKVRCEKAVDGLGFNVGRSWDASYVSTYALHTPLWFFVSSLARGGRFLEFVRLIHLCGRSTGKRCLI